MAWQNPKTDWVANPKNPVPEDFNRIEGNIDFLKSDIETKKGVIVAAINDMNQPAEVTNTHAELGNKIRDISKDATAVVGDVEKGKTFYSGGQKRTGTLELTGNATTADVLSGKTFYNTNLKSKVTGTMPNRGAVVITPSTQNQTILAGYHNGSGYVKGDANLVAGNIKSGVNIFGVAGNLIPYSSVWTQRTSSFGDTSIRGVTYGNNMFVAVGVDGKLATSTNGTTWTQRTSSFGDTHIYGVAYGNNMFVAVGNSGKLATSTDGITWTRRTSSFGTTIIRGVTYGNNRFVAVGDSGKLATSTNGTTWTQRTSSFSDTSIRGVTYGNNMFVAGGYYGKLATLS